MEEKNCWEKPSQMVLSASPEFFLQHWSRDSLQALFLSVAAADRSTKNALVNIRASIAIRMVFLLLMVVDFFHLTT